MKEKKILVLFLELVMLIFILFLFLKKIYPFHNTAVVFGIKRENVVFESVSELKYFYEPKANIVMDITSEEGKTFINSDTLNDDDEFKRIQEALLPILSRRDLDRDSFRILSVQTSILRMGRLGNVYKYQLTNLSKFSDLYKGKLLLVVEPEPWLTNETERRLIGDYRKSRSNTGYFEIVHEIFRLSDLNLTKIIQGDHHPNIKGHKVIAEEIADYSISNKFVPCR